MRSGSPYARAAGTTDQLGIEIGDHPSRRQPKLGHPVVDRHERGAVLAGLAALDQVVDADQDRDELGLEPLDMGELFLDQVQGREPVDGGVGEVDLAAGLLSQAPRDDGRPARALGWKRRCRWCTSRRALNSAGTPCYRSTSASALQTSIFVRTRRITSSVNSVVEAWPPRSAVRMPSETASSADS